MLPCDAESQSQFARTICQILIAMRGGSSLAHHRKPGQRLRGADQNTSGAALLFRHDIQAFVYPVNEINIRVTGGTKDHFGSWSDSSPGVSRTIFDTQISFCFDDARRGTAMDQRLSKQSTSDLNRRTIVERTRKWGSQSLLAALSCTHRHRQPAKTGCPTVL